MRERPFKKTAANKNTLPLKLTALTLDLKTLRREPAREVLEQAVATVARVIELGGNILGQPADARAHERVSSTSSNLMG